MENKNCANCKRYIHPEDKNKTNSYTVEPTDPDILKPKCKFNPFELFFHQLPAAARGWGEFHLSIESFHIKNPGIAITCNCYEEIERGNAF